MSRINGKKTQHTENTDYVFISEPLNKCSINSSYKSVQLTIHYGTAPLCLKTRERRMAMDLMICWSTTVRNRKVPISVFMETLATDDRDNKELKTIWQFMVLREYRMGNWRDCDEDDMRPTWSL